MLILYNILLVGLYAVSALYVGSEAFTQAVVHSYRTTNGIFLLTFFALLIYVLHYVMLFSGNRVGYFRKTSLILLCLIDVICFIPLWMLCVVGACDRFFNLILNFTSIKTFFSVGNIPYYLACLFLMTRLISSVYIFKRETKIT